MITKPTIGVIQLIEFQSIFPNEEMLEIEQYLFGIDTTSIVKLSTRMLSLFQNSNDLINPNDFVNTWFSVENHVLSVEIKTKIKDITSLGENKLVIANQETILHLLEIVLKNRSVDNSNLLIDERFEINFFKALLAINSKITRKDEIAFDSTKDIEGIYGFAALTLTQSFSYNDYTNYDIKQKFVTQFVKSHLLFEFISNSNQTLKHCEEFCKLFNINDPMDYLRKIFPFILPISYKSTVPFDIEIPDNESFSQIYRFISNLIIDPLVFEENDSDFIALRSNPIFQLEKNKFRTLFDLFLVENLYNSLYFTFNNINKNIEPPIKNFRQFITSNFSEEFLFYYVIEAIFKGRSYIKISGKDFREMKIDAGPDFYVRNGNKIFLFESKDNLINKNVKHSHNFSEIEIELKKKFYKSGNQNEAILQLINTIEKILSKTIVLDDNYSTKSIRIYPIIISYHEQFNTAGMNYIINEWFQTELKQRDLIKYKIHPISIINIDTLIFYSKVFQTKKITFDSILDDFFSYLNLDQNRKFNTEIESISYLNRQLIPFSQYFESKSFFSINPEFKERLFSLLYNDSK